MWSGLEPPYAESVRLAGRPRRQAVDHRSRAVPPGDAGAGDRGFRLREARSGRFSRRMEMGRHPRAGVRRRQRTRRAHRADVFAHRRGHFEELSRSAGVAELQRLARRRTADPARRPGAELQRAAAAAEPQGRDAEADRGISRASARLRSSGRRRRGPARLAVRGTARAAGGLHRAPRASAARSLAAGAVHELGRARRRARRSGLRRRRRGCRRGRRRHDQAARRALCARPAEGPVVEMEARSVHGRRRADVCAARQRQALVLLFRLHLRRLDARSTARKIWCRSARPISASPTRN